MTDQETAEAQALRLVATHFPRALGAVLGGSAAQGRATSASDLDVAVLVQDSDSNRREVVRHDGRLVELFLNTATDMPEFFEWDRARRRGTVRSGEWRGSGRCSGSPTAFSMPWTLQEPCGIRDFVEARRPST